MTLHFFNTLSRKKEEFKPILEPAVKMYACGPTVYNHVHIGNLRAYTVYDLVRRYLKYKGYEVVFVSNITDVDDKTIRDSQKEKVSLTEFTKRYTQSYLEDLKTLRIDAPDIMPLATETIPEMIAITKKLIDNGLAYQKDGSWYFRVSKFKNYGALAQIDTKNLKANADGRLNDADEYTKDDVRDFALWKAYEPADGDVFWETELGKGRPGWHIECSAMSQKYLGDTFDIHVGGCDLMFPHHTNEIAQSEGANGKKFVNFWLHNAHLMVNGQKMAKSLGNFYTLKDLISKGYKPEAIRYQLLSTHYRQELNFTEDSLKQIPSTLQRFYDFQERLLGVNGEHNKQVHTLVDDFILHFEEFMDDDLNISGALGTLFDFMRDVNKLIDANQLSKDDAELVLNALMDVDEVLGVLKYNKGVLDADIDALVQERELARKSKNFRRSDEIRDELKKKNIVLEDTPQGVRWKRV